MATKKEAEEVLNRHANRLRRLGAHALGLRQGKEFGLRGPVILAWVPPGFKGRFPAQVSATILGRKVVVPIKIEEQERMRAEKL